MRNKHHHNLDYYSYCSGIRCWNSTFKVVFSLISLLAVIVCDSVFVSIFTILFMGLVSVVLGKVHFDDYLNLMKVPIVFILLSGFAIAFQIGGDLSGSVELPNGIRLAVRLFETDLYISKSGLLLAIKVGLKAFGAVSAMYMMTLSTPMGDILSVLRRMHVPGLIVELMHLIYRYIFLLSDINNMQKDAAASRMGYHNFRSSLRSFSYGLSNLLILALRHANASFDAMEARGYDGELRILEDVHSVDIRQILIFACYLLITIGIVAVRLFI